MSALHKCIFTQEEYAMLEEKADYRSQYVAGELYAMSGAQPWHIKITGNIITGLDNRFRGKPCDVYFTDIRVRV